MLDFTDILRPVKGKMIPEIKLAVIGNASTQHISTAIKNYGAIQHLGIDIFDAGFHQERAQVFDHNSELYKFNPDFVFIYWSSETLYNEFLDTDNRKDFADTKVSELEEMYKILLKHNIRILQSNLSEFTDNVYGSFSLKRAESFPYQVKKFNYLLLELISKYNSVFPVDLCSISSRLGRNQYFDDKIYIMANITISLPALPAVAKSVIDVLQAIKGKIKKCIILDCDNTLWGGVIGDDGIENIKIGDLGSGKAYVQFQKWLRELKNRGILLAVVSKNNQEIAEKPFKEHPDMILRLDDFVAFIANWESKADNIKAIQEQLNIGMDSMVFIDDSLFEREAVKSMIPDIEVPDMPKDPCKYVSFLSKLNLFETSSSSDEDKNRTQQYREESSRKASEATYASYDDYLKSLQMKASCKDFDSFHIPRIAQLSQRSNQFNFRTVRMSESEVQSISENQDNRIGKYFELKDTFGDYGLIGYVVLEKKDKKLFISNWVMSCRVLKRTMEEFIINHIITIANQIGAEYVTGEYIPTQKNTLVKDIFANFNFHQENGIWAIKISDYQKKDTFIEEA